MMSASPRLCGLREKEEMISKEKFGCSYTENGYGEGRNKELTVDCIT